MKWDIEKIISKSLELGVEYIKGEYSSVDSVLTFKCKCGEEFERDWRHVKRGQVKCKKCCGNKKYTIEEVKNKCRELGIECLSKEYKNNKAKMDFKCSCGRSFSRAWADVVNNGQTHCSVCCHSTPYTLDEVNEICNSLGIVCLEDKYVNVNTKMKFKCSCGEIFEKTFTQIVNLNQFRCKKCSHSESLGECIIREFLEKNNIEFKQEYRIEDCRNKNPLPFDFAILQDNTVKLLIEFDGIQHFKPRDGFGGEQEYNTRIVNDEIKDNYCKLNGIKLIRIPYWEIRRIEEILTQLLL